MKNISYWNNGKRNYLLIKMYAKESRETKKRGHIFEHCKGDYRKVLRKWNIREHAKTV